MDLKQQKQLRLMLTEAIVKLCRNEAFYEDELRIEGTICIVSDRTSVIVAHITESVGSRFKCEVEELSDSIHIDLSPPILEAEGVSLIDREHVGITSNEDFLGAERNDSCGSVMRQSLSVLSDADPTVPGPFMEMDVLGDPVADVTRSTNGRFRCPHCDKSYGFKHTLRDHINTHLGRRPHVCQHCDATFTHLASLCAHVKRRHNDSIPTQFQCQVCGEKAMNYQSMKQHYTWRHRDVPFPLEDQKPPNGINDPLKLLSDSSNIEAPQCAGAVRTWKGKRRANKLAAVTVKLQEPSTADTFVTGSACGFTENLSVPLPGQMNSADNCELDSLALLESFERQDYKRMMCDTNGMMDSDFANEIGSPASADDDDKKNILHSESFEKNCESIKNVMQYFEKINVESADGKYSHRCRTCGNMFKNRSSLPEHLNSHFGMRPHACIQCGDRFAHHSSLHNHMRNKHSFVSTAERQAGFRHQCIGCNRRFRFPSELERHLRCNPEHSLPVMQTAVA